MLRKWFLCCRQVAVGALALMLLAAGALAQSDRGSIAGTVTDATGAVIGGATVTVTGVTTGSVYKTVASSNGYYRVSELPIGSYDVAVEAPLFKSSLHKGVIVQIETVSALNVTLTPGNAKEEVTVVADAPQLQSESSEVATVVSEKQIKELPLALSATGQSFLRSPQSFIFLTPGTAGPGTNSDHASSGIFESKLAGGQNFGTEILLDGASVQRQDTVSAFDQTAPSVEALNEFKVTISTPTAQYGRTSGGVQSYSTKSGSNAYHGSLYYLFRNEALDANSWTNNFFGSKKPRDRQNDYGGSLGGPVRIPHLYNGKDKTFFFFSWEQYRNPHGTSNITTLPTAAERTGDFSALLGPGLTNPDGSPVINPCNGQQVLQGQVFDPTTTQTVGGVQCRLPFANNQVPLSSAVAQKVLGYLPSPNRPGLINNYSFDSSNPIVETTMSWRVDENLTDKHKLFFSYSSREQAYLNGTPVLPGPLDPNYRNRYLTHYLRAGWDYVISPTVLNHLNVGLNRVNTQSVGVSVTGVNWDSVLGIGNASGQTFPQFNFGGNPWGISYQGLSAGNDDRNLPNSLVVADNLSWTKGRHSVKIGGEWRAFRFSILSQANNSPSYNYGSSQTAYEPNTNISGDPFASFLVGAPAGESLTVRSVYPRWNQYYYAFYAQDDVKFNRLTLNLGFRWDVDQPRTEAHGAGSVLSLTAANPATPGQLGALIFGKNATGAQTYHANFGPRVGFSYQLFNNTVIRGGYSIYYAPLSYSDFGGSLTSGATANPSFNSQDNFTPVQSPDAGFPSYTPPTNLKDPTLVNGTDSAEYVAASYGKPGMVQNWTLEYQHEFTSDLIFSIGYVGQHGTRLRSNLAQVNTINPKYNSLGTALQDSVTSPEGQATLATLGVSVPSWFESVWGGSGRDTVGQLLRPYPQFGQIGTSCCLENLGQSTYNALQTKLERRFRNGLNLLASYTFSKTLTDADSNYPVFTGFNSNVFGAQNAYNLKAEKSVSYQDIPHTFVLSYLYELPVGPGKKYLTHGAASKVLGGWQISAIHRYQSGSPAVINEYANSIPGNAGSGAGNIRFSLVPGQPLLAPNRGQYHYGAGNTGCSPLGSTGLFGANSSNNLLNCAALQDPNAGDLVAQRGYSYGNLPPTLSYLRSPGYVNEDFALIKKTQLAEGHNLIFKADLPNLFNRHVFAGIDGNPYSSTFGVPGGGGRSVLNSPRQIQLQLRYEF